MDKGLQLGITSIGDLLLRNKISEITDKEKGGIEDVDLRIPAYQRPYKWTAKNANQLFDDVFDAMMSNKDKYRVGTLILNKDKDKDGKTVYNIVDGQQRIITFSLLLSCFDDTGHISFLDQGLTQSDDNIKNVINNRRTLDRRVRNIRKDENDNYALMEYKKFKEYIIKNCELIVVMTEDLSEAFQFFDSQNARGKALYPHDLLKAYHLRELGDLTENDIRDIVKMWEELDQKDLSKLFQEYLYRVREWIKGNKSYELNEQNIDLFKGVTSRDNHPYAQFYKGAYAYADDINRSKIPFTTGLKLLSTFQLNAPIIAGKPFFQYTKHYFDLLADIENNDKYEGYFIQDNEIVKTLDNYYKSGVGNGIARKMFNMAILLYVDRFCPGMPSRSDYEYLDQFTIYAFIWAYSMRAQYRNVGWLVAQNYIMGTSEETKDIINSFNMYKIIANADSPRSLLSILSDRLIPLKRNRVRKLKDKPETNISENNDGIYCNYLYHFSKHKFLED